MCRGHSFKVKEGGGVFDKKCVMTNFGEGREGREGGV